jgi:hypothetical protein
MAEVDTVAVAMEEVALEGEVASEVAAGTWTTCS